MMPKIHPRLRSQFREEARRIVAQDRLARKSGVSQNTIGLIAIAMAKAYQMGVLGIGDPTLHPLPDKVGWNDLPPLSRELLDWISHGLSSQFSSGDQGVLELECDVVDGTTRWFYLVEGRRSVKSWPNRSVTPLLKHGLIEAIDGIPGRYQITTIGKELCSEYWRRSDECDDTLPLLSVCG
ncbi:hypothetical protein QUA99_25315 [Microcoleus sp. F10-B2]